MEFKITYQTDDEEIKTIEVFSVNNILDAIMKCYVKVGVVNIIKLERID